MYVLPDTWHHQMRLKKHEYKQITTRLAANTNPIIVGHMKNTTSSVIVKEQRLQFYEIYNNNNYCGLMVHIITDAIIDTSTKNG